MGGRRYSLDRYSVNREYRTIEIAESFAAALGTVAGPAIPVAFQERYGGTLRSAVCGTVSLISAFTGAVELHAAAWPSVNLPVETAFSAVLRAVPEMRANVEAEARLSGILQTQTSGSKDIPTRAELSGEVSATVRMLANIVTDMQVSGAVLSQVRAVADEVIQCDFAGAMGAGARGSKNIPAGLASMDALSCRSWASKNIPARLALEDSTGAQVRGSKNIMTQLDVWGVLTALPSATTQTTETASFQLTIPPGGELRIDSDVFTVLLNNQNALHTQSGDWITVSRELLRVLIESASGGRLEGQLIYTERFL